MISRKLQFAFVLALSTFICAPASYGAQAYGSGHVIYLRTIVVYVKQQPITYVAFAFAGNGLGGIDPVSCTGDFWGARFSINSSSPNYKEMLSLLLSAKLSGQPISASVSDCSGVSNTFNTIEVAIGTD